MTARRMRRPGRLVNGTERTSEAMIRPIRPTASTGPGRPPEARQLRRGVPLQLREALRLPGRAPRRRQEALRRRPDRRRRPGRAQEQLPGARRTRKPGQLANGTERTSEAMIRHTTTTANTGPGRHPEARQLRRGVLLLRQDRRRRPGRVPRLRRDPPRQQQDRRQRPGRAPARLKAARRMRRPGRLVNGTERTSEAMIRHTRPTASTGLGRHPEAPRLRRGVPLQLREARQRPPEAPRLRRGVLLQLRGALQLPDRAPARLKAARKMRRPGPSENGTGRTSGAMIRPTRTTASTGPGRPPEALRLRRGVPLQRQDRRQLPGRAPRRRQDPLRRRLPARRRRHPRRPWRRTFTERAARRPEPSRRS